MANTICVILLCIAIMINAWGIYDLQKKYRDLTKITFGISLELFGLLHRVNKPDSKKKGKK